MDRLKRFAVMLPVILQSGALSAGERDLVLNSILANENSGNTTAHLMNIEPAQYAQDIQNKNSSLYLSYGGNNISSENVDYLALQVLQLMEDQNIPVEVEIVPDSP